jgi:hypothetical protein
VNEISSMLAESARTVHSAFWQASFYAATLRHVLRRAALSLSERLGRTESRIVFVVGCPRSGTSFVAQSIGALPGFVDLGEVIPLRASIAELADLPSDDAGHRILGRLSLVQGLRGGYERT